MTKLILDACCNHLGNRKIIEEMILVANDKGADYIKFQLYDVDQLNKDYPNRGVVYTRLKECQLDLLDVNFILKTCTPLNIVPMFTIFDPNKLTILKQVDKDNIFALKIASPDLLNSNLIGKILEIFPMKELCISTGMHSKTEIELVRKQYLKYNKINWLYCVSRYPTYPEDIEYNELPKYDGFSDHSVGLSVIKNVILRYPELEYYERHFTLSRNLPITDKEWSVGPDELQELRSILDCPGKTANYKLRWIRE
jgi:N,N'-diacetyllegionaminate synthase